MKITCESCGGEDWLMTYYQRRGTSTEWRQGSHGLPGIAIVYSAMKCKNCGRIYPLANLTDGLYMHSAEHARDFLKNAEIGQRVPTYNELLEEYKKYRNKLQNEPPPLTLLPTIDAESIKIMQKKGISSLKDFTKEDPKELSKILDLPQEQVEKWIQAARDALPPPPPLNLLPVMDKESIKIMQKVGIRSLQDLVKEDPKELCKILDLPQEQVEKWIREANEIMTTLDEKKK